ncbi:SpoIIE family protein phosphatase [Desulfurispora thermophila]|uniref:SpoIIE family protein phosphatase n=1 Tax=Desulfurispora thermophila TaxID=265470 RepID=UPI0003683A25|nr:SpoIIE family protein phosphatase [Desulfurispora thermophila]
MRYFLDVAWQQLTKAGEELCGDSVEVVPTVDGKIVVLSDGLGSGVKANILSCLTVKTASTMFKMGGKVDEVIETLLYTLPICKVRHLAYSTFAILSIREDGQVYLAEYDTPQAIVGRAGCLRRIERQERVISDKKVAEAYFTLEDGDWIVLVSDGILHAGIGGVFNMGWGHERLSSFLCQLGESDKDAGAWVGEIVSLCHNLYGGKPGDDASVVVVKARLPRLLTLLVGPPADTTRDREVVEKLLHSGGRKIVCGGSTGNMVGRFLGQEVLVDLSSTDSRVPPLGILPGIDLVTEGTLTLAYALELLRQNAKMQNLSGCRDGASRLVMQLLWADKIHFLVGTAVNPAQLAPQIPSLFAYKQRVIDDLVELLKTYGKEVIVEHH